MAMSAPNPTKTPAISASDRNSSGSCISSTVAGAADVPPHDPMMESPTSADERRTAPAHGRGLAGSYTSINVGVGA
jgi:hypothetical protein